MKILLLPLLSLGCLLSCTNDKKAKEVIDASDNKISLHANTINSVKLSDTLVIYESTCRGCAYETSTHFVISDSMGIVKLWDVVTSDSNSPDMNGGSVSKDLVLVPQKPGTTVFKLYKFWSQLPSAADSADYTRYTLEVHN